jgi:pimeloyl-ACP methyl ester carboxylesterase
MSNGKKGVKMKAKVKNDAVENGPSLEEKAFNENRDFIHDRWEEAVIDEWETFIFDVGEGEPIVFVPIARNIETFDSLLIKHFVRTNRVITYRRREDEKQVLDIGSRTEDIKRVLGHLGIEKAHFVSHSSGSVAATSLALKEPERFLSYVWMNLSARPTMDMSPWKKVLADALRFVPVPDRIVVGTASRLCSGNRSDTLLYERVRGAFLDIIKTANVKNIKKWFVRNVWTMAHYDWTTGLERLDIPILLINSDNDIVNSVDAMRLIEKQLPNCYGCRIVEGGRHFFQYTRHKEVIGHMEEFYGEIS